MIKQVASPACRAVTCGPNHHFFGYYGICPWDITERYILCMESEFSSRPPTAEDTLTIGFVDTFNNGVFTKAAETRAWNFQQGCFLRWNPSRPDCEIFYNDRRGDRYIAVLLNIFNGQRTEFSRPLYDISADGRRGLSLNFARLNDTRPGYGYAGLEDPFKNDPYPAEDGIYMMELDSPKTTLIVSYAQIAEQFLSDELKGRKLWFNHLMFNTDASRFVFLARYEAPLQPSGARWLTSMFTANADGSDLYCLSKHCDVSHFDWYDSNTLLVWTERPNYGKNYYLLTDKTQYYEVIGRRILTEDGHCSFSPGRKWVLTDTYPDAQGMRSLILFDFKKEKALEIGRFRDLASVWGDNWQIRCDLHPRWSRTGKSVCFDSAMADTRQMYVLDISNII